MGRRYLGLKQAAPVPVGHQVEVQIFGGELLRQLVAVRDLTTGVLFTDDGLLVPGAPADGTVEGAEWAVRSQRLDPGAKLRSQFRGRVAECSIIDTADAMA